MSAADPPDVPPDPAAPGRVATADGVADGGADSAADRGADAALQVLARRLGSLLVGRGWRMATAESCTGGWIAKALTDIAGSSDWFEAGFVTYSNRSKAAALGVNEALLAERGAVSEEVVSAMAAGARERTGCEVAVAVSGIAGPGGGSADKPVGLVCFAWALPERDWGERRIFAGDREAVRRESVRFALERLYAALAG